MKVVCVGCSFTDGLLQYQTKHHGTYPYILGRLLPEATIYNLGHKGSDNLFSLIMIEQAIKEIQPDVIVRQVASPQRFFIVKPDINVNFFEFVKNIVLNYNALDKKKLQHFINFFTPTTGVGKLYDEKTQDNLRNMHFRYHNLMLSQYQTDAYLNYGDILMEQNKIKNVTFSWLKNNKYKDCVSIEETIGFNENYLCDPQGHFNAEGNALVAEQVKNMIMEKR